MFNNFAPRSREKGSEEDVSEVFEKIEELELFEPFLQRCQQFKK
jgi:hypothetical protein